MAGTRDHALRALGDRGRLFQRRRPLGRRQRRHPIGTGASTAPLHGTAMRTVAYSATGFLTMLGTGSAAAFILGPSDSFAGLGMASLVATTLAPLAAAVGASIGMLPHRSLRLVGPDAMLSAGGFGIALVAGAAAWVWVSVPLAISMGLLGLTAALILRAALLERAHQSAAEAPST